MPSTSDYKFPPYALLNFRTQGDLSFKETSRTNPSTKKQETFYDFNNESGWSYKIVTPPCETRYPHLRVGGDYNRSQFSKTQNTANIIANILKDGTGEQFQAERNDFFARMAELNKCGLDHMYDADIGGAATFQREKAKRYYKKKTPEEQEVKARENFHKAATIPLKTSEGTTSMKVKTRAFNRDGDAREVHYCQPNGSGYIEMSETPELHSGAIVSLAFQIRPYCMSKEKFGITYSLVPDVIVYSTGTPGGSGVSAEVIDTPNRTYQFSTVEGKNGKFYVNSKDEDGRRLLTRLATSELEWNDLQNGTLGKFSGVTKSSAKLTGTLKEDTNDPESVAMFDYWEQFAKAGVQHCLDDVNLLTKAKAEISDNAKEISAENGEPYEETYRTMIDEIFNSPVANREDNDYRQLKITQRQYPYDNEETPNVIPLQDSDGNDVTETMELRRGAKIAPIVSPSFYFMPDGGFGVKLEVSLRHGIQVHSNPEGTSSGSGVLYSFDNVTTGKRERDSDENSESKRIRTE